MGITPTFVEAPNASTEPDRRRWAILAVLCLSVFLIVVDGTIVNVALPTLVRDLGATNSELQWIVDAYTLVFASLLLVAGSIGDRFGRRARCRSACSPSPDFPSWRRWRAAPAS